MVVVVVLALLASAGIARALTDLDKQLMEAVTHGDVALVKRLLDKGADPLARCPPDGYWQKGAPRGHALRLAAVRGHMEVVKLLIERGAYAKTADLTLPLSVAAKAGNMELVKLLIEKGAHPDPNELFWRLAKPRQGSEIWPPLIRMDGWAPRFIPFSKKSWLHPTALVSAAESGHFHVAKFLLKGADVNAGMERGFPALKAAV